MFGSPLDIEDRAEQTKKRKIIGITIGVFVIVVAVMILVSARRTPDAPPPGQPVTILEDALRAGSPEFDEYRKFITIDNQDATESQNLIGQKLVVARGFLANRGSRVITGAEVKAVLYDLDNKPVAERVAVPIPKTRASLGPNETLAIQVNVDPVPPGAAVARFEIVVQGLKFQE
jgi:hypothetical protein